MTETITEMVEREAAQAEAENPEPGSEPEPEPTEPTEPEPEPTEPIEPASSITVSVEREKKLKSEDTRHENALKKIYGDDFEQHVFCPLCIGQGFLVPIPPDEQPEEIWQAITALSGRLPSGTLNIPDEFQVCARCDGWGNVGTPSKSEHHASVPCRHCDSRGYFDLSDALHRGKLGLHEPLPAPVPLQRFDQWPALTPEAPVQTIAPPAGWADAGKPGADTFGRWPGHPRYGIDPTANGGQW